MADDHPGTPTDELYRLPVCSGLSSPPTNYFAPPIQYSPVEHPPRSGCCSSIPFPTRADPRLPPSYVLFDKKASSFGAERGFPPRTLADDRIWETLELEGAGTNSHLPYPVTPRAPPPDTNGWKWLAPHHFPYADSRPVVDRPPWTQHTLSQFSYTAAVDLVHPSQENDPAILVDDCRFNGGETSVVEEPPKAESLVEGQPCDLSHPVDKSPSGETDPEVHTPTSPTSVEHLFRRIENGLCECTWRNDSEHPCGFTSRRIVYIKQHIKRVHLQLRCRIICLPIARSSLTPVGHFSVRSVGTDFSLGTRA